MADSKISALNALLAANLGVNDEIPIVDTSAGETKRISYSDLFAAVNTILGSDPAGNTTDLTERLSSMDANIAARGQALAAHQQATDDMKVPRMRAYNGGSVQSLASGTLVQVSFDTTRYEYPVGQFGGGLQPVWTCQEDGHYAGIANIGFAGGTAALTGAWRSVNINVSDSHDISHATQDAPQGGTVVHPFSVPFEDDFTAGDFIRVKAFQFNAGTIAVNINKGTAYSPEFSIHKQGYWQNSNVDTTDTGGTAVGGTVFTPLPAPTTWYSAASPFKQTIATLGVTPRGNSAAIVNSIFSRGPGNVNVNEHTGSGLPTNSNDFSHPVYMAGTADPSVTIATTNYNNPDVTGATIHIPAAAQAARGSDFSFGIVQATGTPLAGWEYDFWNVTTQPPYTDGGGITCGFARRNLITGTGINAGGSANNDRGGITSARFSHGLGVVRADEWEANTIDHALFCAISGWFGRCYPGPAAGGVTGQLPASGVGSDPNAPPMGMLLQLNPALDISACPTWLKRLLQAMMDYGMYIGDNGGSTLNFHTESETPYRAFGVTPTCQQHLDTVFSHSGSWNMMTAPLATKAAWIANLTAMTPPTP